MDAGARPSAVRRLAVLLVAGALLGAVLGVVWEWLWEPPAGAAFRGEWYLAPEGITEEVSATAWFAVLGLAGGLVLGVAAALLCRGRELVTLAGVCLASVLAAWAMFHVGHLLGPPDPHEVAAEAADLDPIPGDLRLAGADLTPWPLWFESSSFVALPAGALSGVVVVFLGGSRRRQEG